MPPAGWVRGPGTPPPRPPSYECAPAGCPWPKILAEERLISRSGRHQGVVRGGRRNRMQSERYPTESALLTGAAGGHPEAVQDLIESFGPGAYRFVFHRCRGHEPPAQPLLHGAIILH